MEKHTLANQNMNNRRHPIRNRNNNMDNPTNTRGATMNNLLNTQEINKTLKKHMKQRLEQTIKLTSLRSKANFIRHIVKGLQDQEITLTPKNLDTIVKKAEEMFIELGLQIDTPNARMIKRLFKTK